MNEELSRRTFLKAAAVGTVTLAAMSQMGGLAAVAEAGGTEGENAAKTAAAAFDGKAKFAGAHNIRKVSEDLVYLGVSDRRLELFENVYPIPRGVSYNSYLLLDEQTVLFDTVDRSVNGQFFENLAFALNGRKLNYFVVHHMEPDHCSAISEVLQRYPEAKILCSEPAAKMINQFFNFDVTTRGYTVTEGMELATGKHKLMFLMAPMVHWPEVMMTYDATDGILFSADAFGTFGALNGNLFADEVNFETEWLPDARRYYTNIVGKYGPQVQAVLAKAATVEIKTICPLHGPIWRDNLAFILDKYDKWSSYTPEDPGAVMVVYGSVYGGTENAANIIAGKLSEGGVRNVAVYDVSKTHVSELIAEAFRCSHIVFASITYNMGIFTPMKNLLMDLQAHNVQNRSYALVENGSWSPASGKLMKEILSQMADMRQIGDTVTVVSTTNSESYDQLCILANALIESLSGTPVSLEETPVAVEQWRCKVCGYVYEGDALPEGYTCPICGVGADMFEKIS